VRKLLLYLFSHRTVALLRWDLHFIWIRLTNRRPELNGTGKLFLNLGSGPRGSSDPGWVNLDGYKDTNVHFLADISRRLPFPDNRFSGIFCEHVFEHFDEDQGQNVLRECYRVMESGGRLRLIVPDGGKILENYVNNPSALIDHRQTRYQLPMEAVNSWFRQRYEHQCIYDFEYLAHQLSLAGFSRVRQCAYGEGSELLLLDDQRYEWESLYVEAEKN
jgi:predicted SAM-dependent methyltransferase